MGHLSSLFKPELSRRLVLRWFFGLVFISGLVAIFTDLAEDVWFREGFAWDAPIILAEAITIGGSSLVIGSIIGVGLARLLVMLLGVVFTIPAQGLDWPILDLLTLVGVALLGMMISTWVSSRRLASIKVVEALREL